MDIHEEFEQLHDKKLAQDEEKEYDDFMMRVEFAMRDPNTRIFIRAILDWCGFYRPVVPELDKSLHAEGRRIIGCQIKNVLDKIDPKIYHELMIEGVQK
jgi:hypothetical protein